jgi:hypothetical protein
VSLFTCRLGVWASAAKNKSRVMDPFITLAFRVHAATSASYKEP